MNGSEIRFGKKVLPRTDQLHRRAVAASLDEEEHDRTDGEDSESEVVQPHAAKDIRDADAGDEQDGGDHEIAQE